MYRHASVAFAAFASMLLAGCGGPVNGSAQPVSDNHNTSHSKQGDGSPDQDLPQNGAPAVENPLDASVLENDPCEAMNSEQAEEFPGDFEGADVDQGDCVWTFEGEDYRLGYITASPESGNPRGLTKYYGSIDEDTMKVIPERSINGYPAVKVELDLRTNGNCVIKLGLRDDLVFDSQITLEEEHPSYDDPCEIARKFSGFVVDNLKEAK